MDGNNDEVYQNIWRREKRADNYIGFSDWNKDGGYLKANWENLCHSKERLSKVSEENDVKVIFFDGRGGPPARGGGKTHQFYTSQGKTIANNKIELNNSRSNHYFGFGNKDQAKYNFEQLLTAGIENEVLKITKRFNRKEKNFNRRISRIELCEIC